MGIRRLTDYIGQFNMLPSLFQEENRIISAKTSIQGIGINKVVRTALRKAQLNFRAEAIARGVSCEIVLLFRLNRR